MSFIYDAIKSLVSRSGSREAEPPLAVDHRNRLITYNVHAALYNIATIAAVAAGVLFLSGTGGIGAAIGCAACLGARLLIHYSMKEGDGAFFGHNSLDEGYPTGVVGDFLKILGFNILLLRRETVWEGGSGPGMLRPDSPFKESSPEWVVPRLVSEEDIVSLGP